jgi:hypothetical protein
MTEEELLQTLLQMLPGPAYFAIAIIFGIIGMVCFYRGRRSGKNRLKWGGVVLMLYPYLLGSDATILFVTGCVICGLIYFFRD